jgi:hypothetical protein
VPTSRDSYPVRPEIERCEPARAKARMDNADAKLTKFSNDTACPALTCE